MQKARVSILSGSIKYLNDNEPHYVADRRYANSKKDKLILSKSHPDKLKMKKASEINFRSFALF